MNQRKVKEKLVLKTSVKVFISKLMLTIIVFLIGMIITKNNSSMKEKLNEIIYEKSFKFTSLKTTYEKYFGNILSLNKVVKTTQPVFSEKLNYEKIEKYENGAKLTVTDNYMVPALESGVVVYVGTKEPYGQAIIVEQIDGIDTMYANINSNNLKLYDYVEKGNLLGETIGKDLFLVFQKNGNYLDYKEYI